MSLGFFMEPCRRSWVTQPIYFENFKKPGYGLKNQQEPVGN